MQGRGAFELADVSHILDFLRRILGDCFDVRYVSEFEGASALCGQKGTKKKKMKNKEKDMKNEKTYLLAHF